MSRNIAVLLLSLIGGHAAVAQQSVTAEEAAPVVVTVAHPGPISPSVSLPLAVAREHGLFAKNGLAPRFVGEFPGAARLIGKEAELGYFGSAAILLAITEHGTDMRILGAVNNGRISFHLVTKAGIAKPDDLRGKRIGVFNLGTGIWVATVQVLEHFGLDPVRDNIVFLPIGNVTQVAKALVEGRIDAGMLNPTQSPEMKAKGFSVLVDTSTLNLQGAQSLPVTTQGYLQARPEIVEKFATALVEATAFSLDPKNKSAVLQTIMREFRLADPADAEKGYADLANLYRKPYVSVESLKKLQRIIV